ncbi:MAG: ParA family protein [Sulfolobaceae archaeon]|nr:ParA family protein [Sulfolobaceae archaeon]
MKRLRVPIAGVKGGVGKTTLALYSALSLSRKYRVLLFDKDPLSFSSHVLGFDAPGFILSLYKKDLDEKNYFKSFNKLDVFKYFSDPLMDRDLFYKVYKTREYERILADLFKGDYNIIIVDYGVVYDMFDEFTSYDYMIFRKYSSELNYKDNAVGVTDPSVENIASTVKYARTLVDSKMVDGVLAIVINMVPATEEESLKVIGTEIENIKRYLGSEVLIIPFLNELFSFAFIGEDLKK